MFRALCTVTALAASFLLAPAVAHADPIDPVTVPGCYGVAQDTINVRDLVFCDVTVSTTSTPSEDEVATVCAGDCQDVHLPNLSEDFGVCVAHTNQHGEPAGDCFTWQDVYWLDDFTLTMLADLTDWVHDILCEIPVQYDSSYQCPEPVRQAVLAVEELFRPGP